MFLDEITQMSSYGHAPDLMLAKSLKKKYSVRVLNDITIEKQAAYKADSSLISPC